MIHGTSMKCNWITDNEGISPIKWKSTNRNEYINPFPHKDTFDAPMKQAF